MITDPLPYEILGIILLSSSFVPLLLDIREWLRYGVTHEFYVATRHKELGEF